jgi:predicted transcriptional regulator
MYGLTKSVSLTIDFSPDLYDARLLSFEDISLNSKRGIMGEFRDRVEHLSKKDRKFEGVDQFEKLMADIDKKIDVLEGERTVLLYLRSRVNRAAKESIQAKDLPLRDKMIISRILNREAVE